MLPCHCCTGHLDLQSVYSTTTTVVALVSVRRVMTVIDDLFRSGWLQKKDEKVLLELWLFEYDTFFSTRRAESSRATYCILHIYMIVSCFSVFVFQLFPTDPRLGRPIGEQIKSSTINQMRTRRARALRHHDTLRRGTVVVIKAVSAPAAGSFNYDSSIPLLPPPLLICEVAVSSLSEICES